ncbi:MAG: hypothetical protein LBT83_03245 [Tannerella sp.]|nr:hypothetical protein [Tannerella sp.]
MKIKSLLTPKPLFGKNPAAKLQKNSVLFLFGDKKISRIFAPTKSEMIWPRGSTE